MKPNVNVKTKPNTLRKKRRIMNAPHLSNCNSNMAPEYTTKAKKQKYLKRAQNNSTSKL
jgi:hypothetical protein